MLGKHRRPDGDNGRSDTSRCDGGGKRGSTQAGSMTKAARILDLYAKGLSTREIGEVVGCRPEYVRVVARQRMGTSASEIDKRYLSSSLGRLVRSEFVRKYYWANPEYRRKSLERKRALSAKRRQATQA